MSVVSEMCRPIHTSLPSGAIFSDRDPDAISADQ
jgi:hypothetical protein